MNVEFEILLDVKLRAASRQSDAQAAGHVQATDS